MRFPSGDQAIEFTKSECPLYVYAFPPVVASHTCTVLSKPPEAMRFPSGDQATEFTKSECPLYVYSFPPVVASHTCTVLSHAPEAMRFPSGDHATEFTSPECPLYVYSFPPVVASHTCTVSSRAPEAMRFPSGDHATEFTKSELWNVTILVPAYVDVRRLCNSSNPPTVVTPARLRPATRRVRREIPGLIGCGTSGDTGTSTGIAGVFIIVDGFCVYTITGSVGGIGGLGGM